MSSLSLIRDCLDALLHPSAQYDALTRARHRAFMAPRLLGSLAALASFPAFLAMRGAPTASISPFVTDALTAPMKTRCCSATVILPLRRARSARRMAV
ncbi:hypothetical protein, partial [Bradyrhizobium uaiense]|uniref:hypothetical protein n=1 Tax=Bradyrhizobium uaiense TaxID=2594946 RepID=UPI0013D8CFAB